MNLPCPSAAYQGGILPSLATWEIALGLALACSYVSRENALPIVGPMTASAQSSSTSNGPTCSAYVTGLSSLAGAGRVILQPSMVVSGVLTSLPASSSSRAIFKS